MEKMNPSTVPYTILPLSTGSESKRFREFCCFGSCHTTIGSTIFAILQLIFCGFASYWVGFNWDLLQMMGEYLPYGLAIAIGIVSLSSLMMLVGIAREIQWLMLPNLVCEVINTSFVWVAAVTNLVSLTSNLSKAETARIENSTLILAICAGIMVWRLTVDIKTFIYANKKKPGEISALKIPFKDLHHI
jgi:hypothetical protein